MNFCKFLHPKSKVEGLSKTYEAWEFRPSRLELLPVTDLVCIACSLFLPKRYSLVYIAYHRDMMEFMKTDLGNGIIYSYFFIPAGNKSNAELIIQDIKLQHPCKN
ncbi:hypothetical protein D3C87_205050 [compost metagenome]